MSEEQTTYLKDGYLYCIKCNERSIIEIDERVNCSVTERIDVNTGLEIDEEVTDNGQTEQYWYECQNCGLGVNPSEIDAFQNERAGK